MTHERYEANIRLYGKRHLDHASWNAGRLQSHLMYAHKIPVPRDLPYSHGSQVAALRKIHEALDHSWMENIWHWPKKGEKVEPVAPDS